MLANLQKPKPRVLTKWHKKLEAERQLRKAAAFVKKREGGKCRACKKPGNQAHHIVYRSHGGKHETSNLVWVCGDCHSMIHAHALIVTYRESNPAATIHFTRNTQWDTEPRR